MTEFWIVMQYANISGYGKNSKWQNRLNFYTDINIIHNIIFIINIFGRDTHNKII